MNQVFPTWLKSSVELIIISAYAPSFQNGLNEPWVMYGWCAVANFVSKIRENPGVDKNGPKSPKLAKKDQKKTKSIFFSYFEY